MNVLEEAVCIRDTFTEKMKYELILKMEYEFTVKKKKKNLKLLR